MFIIGKWFSLANIILFKANDPLQHLWNPGGPTPTVCGGGGGNRKWVRIIALRVKKDIPFFKAISTVAMG